MLAPEGVNLIGDCPWLVELKQPAVASFAH